VAGYCDRRSASSPLRRDAFQLPSSLILLRFVRLSLIFETLFYMHNFFLNLCNSLCKISKENFCVKCIGLYMSFYNSDNIFGRPILSNSFLNIYITDTSGTFK
jgi:hypothetical protein